LADSSTFAAAAAEVLPSTENPSVHIPPAPGNLSGADLLRLMMGEEPVEESQRTGWDQLLGRIAESYAVPAPDPRQPEIISQVDAAIGQQMRAVLHHPAFQALESNWRALEFLVRRVETCTNLKISLLDLPRQELLSEAGIATLRRALAEDARAIIALMYYFSADEESLLLRFAALARSGRAPILTGLAPEIVGLDGVFGELRRASDARWIGFALPRFLLRLPYGRDTQEIDAVPFEEMPSPPEHQCYLWGHPAAACACLLGQTFSRYGWALRPGAINTIGDLPVHVYHADGETQLKPCAEILLTDEAAGLLLNRGFIPLVSAKGSDEVRIPIFQSVADPSAPLAGRWTR
jgi:type VI secretion system protein ImpC